MEFKSQICTSVEQSKRLLELGLKKETADMAYMYRIEIVNDKAIETEPSLEYPITMLQVIQDDSFRTWRKYIPAWSLHRLMEIMYKGDMFGFVSLTTHNRNIDTIYELVIANIEGLIKIDKFNKDYLEEEK